MKYSNICSEALHVNIHFSVNSHHIKIKNDTKKRSKADNIQKGKIYDSIATKCQC